MKKIIFFLAAAVLLNSCKEENLSQPIDSSKLYGRWLQVSDFGEIIYSKTTRFGEYEKGLVFYEDGSLIGRSESSICVGPNCLMENYEGTWIRKSEQTLSISVESLKGIINQEYTIVELGDEKLVLKIE